MPCLTCTMRRRRALQIGELSDKRGKLEASSLAAHVARTRSHSCVNSSLGGCQLSPIFSLHTRPQWMQRRATWRAKHAWSCCRWDPCTRQLLLRYGGVSRRDGSGRGRALYRLFMVFFYLYDPRSLRSCPRTPRGAWEPREVQKAGARTVTWSLQQDRPHPPGWELTREVFVIHQAVGRQPGTGRLR